MVMVMNNCKLASYGDSGLFPKIQFIKTDDGDWSDDPAKIFGKTMQ